MIRLLAFTGCYLHGDSKVGMYSRCRIPDDGRAVGDVSGQSKRS